MAHKRIPRTPRPQRLPEVESGIPALEELATAYADVRDRRADLTREEVGLKAEALALMHKHKKTIYKRDGIEIRLDAVESIKVKVRKRDEEDE